MTMPMMMSIMQCMGTRMQSTVDVEDMGFGNSSSVHDKTVDINKSSADGINLPPVKKELALHPVEIEKQRLQIKFQGLELTKKRLIWEKHSRKKDRKLERMRLENQRRKLETERLELELRRKELELRLKLHGNDNHA